MSSDFNAVVGARIARARRRRGWQQRYFADMIGRSEAWVSQVERGIRALDSLAMAETIARVLELDVPHVLAFDHRYGPQRGQLAAQPASAQSEDEWMNPLRRTLMASAGGALAEAEIGPSANPLAPFGFRTSRTRPTPDESMLEDLRTVGSAYRRSYRIVPSETLLPLALDQVRLALSLHPAEQPERARTALLRHAGEMAALAAGVHMMDHGHFDKADALLTFARSTAKEIGDADLTAVVFGGRAFLTASDKRAEPDGGRRAEEALDWAQASQDEALKGASPRTQAWAGAVVSEMHASLGDSDGACRALDQARQALRRPAQDELWAGLGWTDEAKLDAYEGGNLLHLGRYQSAIERLTAALDAMEPTMVRHRATALADRAHALAMSGEPDGACADADESLGYVEHVHHLKTFERIEKVSRIVGAGRGHARAALREHILEVRPSFRTHTKGPAPR